MPVKITDLNALIAEASPTAGGRIESIPRREYVQ
jgi:hypothetical protein